MPNRLPPCPLCGPKKRHLPESCPEAWKRDESAPRGDLSIPNDISFADLLPPLRRIVKVLEKLVAVGKVP